MALEKIMRQALDGVGGVHNLPGGLRKLEHGADEVPTVAPAVHTFGILGLRVVLTSSRQARAVCSSGTW